jgi:orotidine-5'-phosphate decarboxylase
LIAVTVLTSHTEDELQQAGLAGSLRDNVLRLATSARAAGLDGVVCSALEAQWLRAELGEDFKLVTPGIRPEGAAQDDQRRIVTPRQAREWGSDYLVVGRPVTGAADPLAMVQLIRQQLGEI